MNEYSPTIQFSGPGAIFAPSVKTAKAALKQAKKAERDARKQVKRRRKAEGEARDARLAALATFHEIAYDELSQYDPAARLQAAHELKAWGVGGITNG